MSRRPPEEHQQIAAAIRALPKGMTLGTAARHLGLQHETTRMWLKRMRYRYLDGRKQKRPGHVRSRISQSLTKYHNGK